MKLALLRIKNIRVKEKYAEGEIPHQAKTGTWPVLLTVPFPYVRDWLNEHPYKNEPNARLICNFTTGAPIRPDSICDVMKQLRCRIVRLLEKGKITVKEENEKLQFLIKTKRWNPYCIRHSAITADSDYLPEYALKKKVRWSMNSKQGSRHIKTRMGNDLKEKILTYNGIYQTEIKKKPVSSSCPRCDFTNIKENKYCSRCSYPLVASAYEEIKLAEETRIKAMEDQTKILEYSQKEILDLLKYPEKLAHIANLD